MNTNLCKGNTKYKKLNDIVSVCNTNMFTYCKANPPCDANMGCTCQGQDVNRCAQLEPQCLWDKVTKKCNDKHGMQKYTCKCGPGSLNQGESCKGKSYAKCYAGKFPLCLNPDCNKNSGNCSDNSIQCN